MKHLVVLVTCLLAIQELSAQSAPEYRMEIGAGAGIVTYQGDYNGSLLKNFQPMAAAVAKYKLNPRMAWALHLSYGMLKGSMNKADTWFPEESAVPDDFKSSIVNTTARFEYNFWPFGTGKEYYGARKLTPFIAMGLGLTFASCKGGGSSAGLQLPLGVGVKYKVGDRWNMAFEWSMHFTSSDKLDGLKDPYGIKSSGLFKNTDSYSVIGVTLTYDIWAKCKICNNDRD
jgi:hypothetical protein